MFNYLRGSIKGRKVAVQTSKLVQQIVNYLIINGITFKIDDTIKILRESYSFCHSLNFRPPSNDVLFGASLITSDTLIKKWLIKMYLHLDDSPDGLEYLDDSISTLHPYYVEWFNELCKNNPDYIGRPYKEWVPIINSHFRNKMVSLVDNAFSYNSRDFSSFIGDLANSTSKLLS